MKVSTEIKKMEKLLVECKQLKTQLFDARVTQNRISNYNK